MKSSKDMLSSILKTTQMGQIGIRSVLEKEMSEEMKTALQSQLREYDAIETEAKTVAKQYNWVVTELNPSVRFMAEKIAKAKLHGKDNTSRIADMMIMGNTRGLIKGMKNSHAIACPDKSVGSLNQKLLETEHRNIEQMEQFL